MGHFNEVLSDHNTEIILIITDSLHYVAGWGQIFSLISIDLSANVVIIGHNIPLQRIYTFICLSDNTFDWFCFLHQTAQNFFTPVMFIYSMPYLCLSWRFSGFSNEPLIFCTHILFSGLRLWYLCLSFFFHFYVNDEKFIPHAILFFFFVTKLHVS